MVQFAGRKQRRVKAVWPMQPVKMKAYGSFAEWKADQTPRNRRLITALTRIVEGVDASCVRSVKWGQGCWIKDGEPRVYIHAEPDHVQLGFYRGVDLRDPAGVLKGKAKYVRFVRVSTPADADAKTLSALVKQVM